MSLRRYLCFCFLVLPFTGCSTNSVLPDFIKTSEQIQLETATANLKSVRSDKLNREKIFYGLSLPGPQSNNEQVTEYRRKMLGIQKAKVAELLAEYDKREASLKKQATQSGYFKLGTKGVGIVSGIASAVLVTASPANAATVAGLAALSSGTAAFQDTAVEVGYSTVVAQAQLEAIKSATATAYMKLKDTSFEFLDSYAASATTDQWNTEMKSLGAAIIELETAIKFTKFDIHITTQPSQ